MRIAVIGGKLQGVEVTYLAHKAGWEVIVIDKNPDVPAVGLCDLFCHSDVSREREFIKELKGVELIIPALENKKTLSSLCQTLRQEDLPFAYDPDAYGISSSKIKSNQLFGQMGIPRPRPWPCGFPLIVKPSGASGSEGVRRVSHPQETQSLTDQPDWVIEEFLEGPSFSIEVIGLPEDYQTFQVTDLEMDARYDCKRVIAPSVLPPQRIKGFEEMALAISKRLQLRGIMDVEVILHDHTLKILEIDARLPSQTPTTVYLSTGINMVERLGALFGQGLRSSFSRPSFSPCFPRGVVYEHIQVSQGRLEVSGEHIMAGAGPLSLYHDFFGADEAISNYQPGKPNWVATLISTGVNREEAWQKRGHVIDEIKKHCSVDTYLDPSPSFF